MFKRLFHREKSDEATAELSAALTDLKTSDLDVTVMTAASHAKSQPKAPRRESDSAGAAKSRTSARAVSESAEEGDHSMTPRLPALISPPVPLNLPNRKLRHSDFNENSIRTYNELVAAINSEKLQLTLGNNIIIPKNLVIRHDLAINFNGFSLISEETTSNARVLDIRSGEVSLVGKGNIFAMGEHSVAVRLYGAISASMPSYTTLTVDEGISLFAPSSYGIIISPNLGTAYGVNVNFSGRIYSRDCIALAEAIQGDKRNLPLIKINDGAKLVADETSGCAISALGRGIWKIASAKISAATGITAKLGQISLTHTKITAHADASSVFLLQENDQKQLDISVFSGSFVSKHGPIISGPTRGLKSFRIKGGEFCNSGRFTSPKTKSLLQISDQTVIRHDVAKFLAERNPRPPEPIPVPESAKTDENTSKKPLETPLEDSTANSQPAPTATKPAIPVAADNKASHMLAEIIADVEKLHKSDYDAGFDRLEAAVAAAKSACATENLSMEKIRDLSMGILAAIDSLHLRPAPKTPVVTTSSSDTLAAFDPVAPAPAAEPEPSREAAHLLQVAAVQPVALPAIARVPLLPKKSVPCDPRFAASRIDELSPLPFWSTGLALVDEFSPSPHCSAGLPRSRFLHRLKKHFGHLTSSISGFFGRIKASFSAGISASVTTFRSIKP